MIAPKATAGTTVAGIMYISNARTVQKTAMQITQGVLKESEDTFQRRLESQIANTNDENERSMGRLKKLHEEEVVGLKAAVAQAVRAGVSLDTPSPDRDGCTAAFLCARGGHSSLLEVLHRNGADLMRCSTADVKSASITTREGEGREFRGDNTWVVGDPLSATRTRTWTWIWAWSWVMDMNMHVATVGMNGDPPTAT